MKEGRRAFVDLLGRVDAHFRTNGGEARLPELEVFWRATRSPYHLIASRSFDRLLQLAKGQGFDEELLPFVEASRLWCRKLGRASPFG
jgi:hypothetical protein